MKDKSDSQSLGQIDQWKPLLESDGKWCLSNGFLKMYCGIKNEQEAIERAKRENWIRLQNKYDSQTICKKCHKRMSEHNGVETYYCLMEFNLQ